MERVRWTSSKDPNPAGSQARGWRPGRACARSNVHRWRLQAAEGRPTMVYNNGRPKPACSNRAYSCCAAWQGDKCNGGGVVAAASKSALTSPPRCGLIVCVPISLAACLRATSQLRAHCPLLWPQMADKRFSRLDGSFGVGSCSVSTVRRALRRRRLACHQGCTGGYIAAVRDVLESVLAVFVCRGL